jgi:cyanophycinase-like exopeptidase
MKDKICGNLLIIGGAEDKKDDCMIPMYIVVVKRTERNQLKYVFLRMQSEVEEEVGKSLLRDIQQNGLAALPRLYI